MRNFLHALAVLSTAMMFACSGESDAGGAAGSSGSAGAGGAGPDQVCFTEDGPLDDYQAGSCDGQDCSPGCHCAIVGSGPGQCVCTGALPPGQDMVCVDVNCGDISCDTECTCADESAGECVCT